MGQGMTTRLLEAGRHLNRARRVVTQKHSIHKGPTQREGAGFVENHPLDRGGTLNHVTTPEEPALAGCQTRRHGDHRGSCQTKRTGARHNQNSDRQLQSKRERRLGRSSEGVMTGVTMAMVHQHHRNLQNLRPEAAANQPPEQKGEQCQRHHAVAEAASHPISEPLDRRSSRLGLFHQGDDAGEGCFTAYPAHLHHQSRLEIEATGTELRSRPGIHRQRLSREAGQVHCGKALLDHSVHRNAISSEQFNALTRPQHLHRDIPHGAIGHHKPGR